MRSPSSVSVGSVIGVVLFCAFLISVTEARAQESGEISGRVMSEAGVPLAGASVSIEGTQLSAITDADGVYAIRGVEPGQRTVVVGIIGYAVATQVASRHR